MIASLSIDHHSPCRLTLHKDREYLWNETRYRRKENGFPNCNLSQARREVGRGSFPGPRDVLGAPPSLKNTEKDFPGGFFLTSNMHKIRPRTPLGELTTFPQTPTRMVRDRHPSPRTFPPSRRLRRLDLGTFGGCDRAGARTVSRAPLWLSTGLIFPS